ncbi:MAG: amidohydrolase [Candidatus Glassbacteria bacterium]|nr:amidohydrolase [Candidatus Glassbacteria bacterium]
MRFFSAALLPLGMLLAVQLSLTAAPPDLDALAQKHTGELLEMYKHFHANPELSFFEKETSTRLAGELGKAGYEVTHPVGKYPGHLDYTCWGVVGILRNGPGPTVLVRGDMDGLPIVENTGLPYASRVRMADISGEEVGVMHACGHDVHTTVLIGTARMLAELKSEWSGTVVIVGQTAEERGSGARALLADGLYERWPVPDYAVAEHTDPSLEAGQVGYCPGWAMANVDMMDITIRGVGAHGARPHQGVDPIVLSAQVINALQTVISRNINPVETGVVTVGSIHGGSKHNIIPAEVKLQLTIRSYKEEVRQKILESIERITIHTARAAGVPEDRLPIIEGGVEFTPALYNDPELVVNTVQALKARLGEDNVIQILPTTGGEDFSEFGRTDHDVPIFMMRLGTAEPGSDPVSRPGLHSPLFCPVPEPTLRTGMVAMTTAVLNLLGK